MPMHSGILTLAATIGQKLSQGGSVDPPEAGDTHHAFYRLGTMQSQMFPWIGNTGGHALRAKNTRVQILALS